MDDVARLEHSALTELGDLHVAGDAAVLVAGVLAKESVLFVAVLRYSLHARGVVDRRVALRSALVALPAAGVVSGAPVLTHAAMAPFADKDPAGIARFGEAAAVRIAGVIQEQKGPHEAP